MKTKADFLLYSDESCPLKYDGNDVMAIGFIYCKQDKKEKIYELENYIKSNIKNIMFDNIIIFILKKILVISKYGEVEIIEEL